MLLANSVIRTYPLRLDTSSAKVRFRSTHRRRLIFLLADYDFAHASRRSASAPPIKLAPVEMRTIRQLPKQVPSRRSSPAVDDGEECRSIKRHPSRSPPLDASSSATPSSSKIRSSSNRRLDASLELDRYLDSRTASTSRYSSSRRTTSDRERRY